MTDKTERQWGVRHPDGRVERITEASANEGYMTAQEYASVRAVSIKGQVVYRTKIVQTSGWTTTRPKLPRAGKS